MVGDQASIKNKEPKVSKQGKRSCSSILKKLVTFCIKRVYTPVQYCVKSNNDGKNPPAKRAKINT